MNTPPQKPDAEQYARIILYQLAALRAEGIQTQSIVTQILSHQRDETHERYLQRVADQETRKVGEIDRIYRECLKMIQIPYKPIPTASDISESLGDSEAGDKPRF